MALARWKIPWRLIAMADRRFGSLVMEDSGGEGPAVVMLHGLGGTSNTFEPLMDSLDGYRVIRPDLPGAGRTALRTSAATVQQLARAVTDGLAGIGVRRAVIVGHSMGTLLAQHMAISAPQRVRGLVLFGAITEPPDAARLALQHRAATALQEGMAGIADLVANGSLSARSKSDNPALVALVRESLMRQTAAGYAAHCKALMQVRAFDPLRIKAPVQLVTGVEDTVAPVAMAQALNTALPFSTLEQLPGVGHWPTIEAPEDCARILQSTLKNFTTNEVTERS